MLPVREERDLLFPAGPRRPEASALPAKLPNLRLQGKGDLLVVQERADLSPACAGLRARVGTLALCRARKRRELLPSRFSGAHQRPSLSGREPYCLGGSLADLPRLGSSPKCGQLLERGWILSSRKD